MARFRSFRPALLVTTILACAHPLPAMANPAGSTVVAGAVRVGGEGSKSVTVTQSTDRAIIDWRNFDIAADETTRFIQPRAESITLNRIASGLPTKILGQLEANGNVFIVNGNGVVFGQGSQVNVGGLVVSTADVDGRSFLRSTGQYRFDRAGNENAEIIVEGTINVRSAGVAAFVAPRFSNSGQVRATLGRIAIGAADRFTLDMAGDGLIRFAPGDGFGRSSGGIAVENSGALNAQGGLIDISAFAARDAINGSVRVDGMVTAGGATRGADGTVQLTGSAGRIAIGATGTVELGQAGTVDASGSNGGSVAINSATFTSGGVVTANGAVAAGDVRINTVGVAALGGLVAANGGASGGTIAANAFNISAYGKITATSDTGNGGTIAIAADNRFIATTASLIDASGAQGGSITVAGGAGANQGLFSSGTMLADGRDLAGGDIALHGQHIDLVGATVRADGERRGGTITIGHRRDIDGKIDVGAATVELSPATALSASARGNGNGGRIDVWSNDLTRAWGTTNARGGTLGGDGGFIELSSRGEVVFGGAADASAPLGARGTLLLDPRNLTIDDATARFPQYQLIDPNPTLGNNFAGDVRLLSTGNLVVTSPNDDFGATDAGAVYLFNVTTGALISTLIGSTINDNIGDGISIVALRNGNYVINSGKWDNGSATNAGAVTFGNGNTGVSGVVSANNSLVGTSSGDQVGYYYGPITVLTNSNYLVSSPNWSNGTATEAGAVTFGNGNTGISGAISANNSLVGTTSYDNVGSSDIIELTNGNYLVSSLYWDNGSAANAGAVTFGSGATGVIGAVSASNSLVGTTSYDQVGSGGILELTNGNYLVRSVYWSNGSAFNAGAVTFGHGTTGVIGAVSASNSLVGTTTDYRGSWYIDRLTNGNYAVTNPYWDNGAATDAGAVTFGNGNTGVSGEVSARNSLVGTTSDDRVGIGGIFGLTNGNYLVSSEYWSNGSAASAGAVTFGNGTTGVIGAVSASNSLVGTTSVDSVGSGRIFRLTNGNYVVSSPRWDNGSATDAGAVTFGNGNTGVSGEVSASNSLVGTTSGDSVGNFGVTPLTNGNYVVNSFTWNRGSGTDAGAVTFANGTTGLIGAVSASNSLVGTIFENPISFSQVTPLTNGNYLVSSPQWDNGAAIDAGAVTFGNGNTGVIGAISASNSLVGTTSGDNVGSSGVTQLTTGNFLVRSIFWDNGSATNAGAVTFGNGTTGVIGAVSAGNSLVGTTSYDNVGSRGILQLTNGNYVVSSPLWDNGSATDAGAVTFGNGNTGVSGEVSASNSLVGTTSNDNVGNGYINPFFNQNPFRPTFPPRDPAQGIGVTALTNGNYLVLTQFWDNGGIRDAGAVTFGNGTTGVSGDVSAANSLVGTTADDYRDIELVPLSNGNYIVRGSFWDNGPVINAGAVTFGNGTTGVIGAVSARNSLVGTSNYDHVGFDRVYQLGNDNYAVTSPYWNYGAGALTFGNGITGVIGAVSASNSLVGTSGGDQLEFVGMPATGVFVARSPSSVGTRRIVVGLSDLNALSYGRASSQDLTISSAAIRRVLDTGTALTLQANNDISVNSAITVTNPTGDGGSLTLAAGRSIFINAGIVSDNGNVSLIANDLLANGVIDAQRTAGEAVISFGSGGSINAGTGRIAIELRDGTGKTNFGSGGITLGSLTGSTISVLNTRGDATGGITINSDATLSGTGTGDAVILSGRSFTNNSGANALAVTGGGRFLVYSQDYAADTRGGIAGSNLYNRSFASTPPSSVTQPGSRFIFARQPTITFQADDAAREYGVSGPTLTGTVTGGLVNGDSAAEAFSGTLRFTTIATQAANVGVYAINPDFAGLTSSIGYAFAPSTTPGRLSITQALLSVTANSATRDRGQPNPTFNGTITGFRNNDTDDVISGLSFGTTASQLSPAGLYAINGAGASAINYRFAYVPGILTVQQVADLPSYLTRGVQVSQGNKTRSVLLTADLPDSTKANQLSALFLCVADENPASTAPCTER